MRNRACRLATLTTAVSLILSGCAVHPLPEDVTHIKTTEIAEHIRCEARLAVQDKAIQMLRKASLGLDPIPGAADLAEKFAHDRSLFRHARQLLTDDRERKFYDRYIETAIAYDFTFDMAEDNAVNTQLDFIRLITAPTGFTLGASASNDRMRENIRKFLVTDKFKDLIEKDVNDCGDVPIGPNLLYPIVGEIGLYELVSTFVDLNEEGITLASADKDKAPAVADQLQFNTAFVGSLNPKVVLSPLGHAFQVADASIGASVSRTDKHGLIVGLSLPPQSDKKTAKKAPAPAAASPYVAVGILNRSIFAARNLSDAQVRAVEAITQFRIDLYYDRSAAIAIR